MKLLRGFSLIELLIAMIVVGIISAVAYPSYLSFITKVNRTEAQRELLRLANIQEHYYVNEGKYASSLILLGFERAEYQTESGRYEIYISASSDTNFNLTAQAKGAQRNNDEGCLTMSINEVGERAADSVFCWN
jgi:type IV pilus assembly protein PilE